MRNIVIFFLTSLTIYVIMRVMIENSKTQTPEYDNRLRKFYAGVQSITLVDPEDEPMTSAETEAEIYFSYGDGLGGIVVALDAETYTDFLEDTPERRSEIMENVFELYHPEGGLLKEAGKYGY